jgi:GT2 family glycosyltransferase
MSTTNLEPELTSQPAEAAISVIVVNWNGEHLLEACLNSLMRQSIENVELILVDNGSTDGSVALVRKQFPDVTVIALDTNTGFSAGNNAGIRRARGRYVAMLNNDAEPDPQWLEEIVKAFEDHPEIGFCASKIVLAVRPDLVDACGDFYTIEGVAGKIGHLEPEERYSKPNEVFGACAGAAVYRRSLLDDVGGFDEEFFAVHEDSDLSFRARLMGYRCLFVPSSIVYHQLGATIGNQSDLSVHFAQRNTEFVYLKNMPLGLLIKYWPVHMLADLASFVSHVQRGKTRAFLKAKLAALRMLPGMLAKRRRVQRMRRVSDVEIDRILLRGWLWERLRLALSGGNRIVPPSDGLEQQAAECE